MVQLHPSIGGNVLESQTGVTVANLIDHSVAPLLAAKAKLPANPEKHGVIDEMLRGVYAAVHADVVRALAVSGRGASAIVLADIPAIGLDVVLPDDVAVERVRQFAVIRAMIDGWLADTAA